jgi:hypothetical protein
VRKECYVTADDYFKAMKEKDKTKNILEMAKQSLIVSGAEVSYQMKSLHDDETKMEIVQKIEELLRELK